MVEDIPTMKHHTTQSNSPQAWLSVVEIRAGAWWILFPTEHRQMRCVWIWWWIRGGNQDGRLDTGSCREHAERKRIMDEGLDDEDTKNDHQARNETEYGNRRHGSYNDHLGWIMEETTDNGIHSKSHYLDMFTLSPHIWILIRLYFSSSTDVCIVQVDELDYMVSLWLISLAVHFCWLGGKRRMRKWYICNCNEMGLGDRVWWTTKARICNRIGTTMGWHKKEVIVIIYATCCATVHHGQDT